MAQTPRGSRLPRLTVGNAVRAALDLGISEFTMSRVARALGVTTPALYRLFPTRDDLTAACLATIGRDQPESPGNLPWRQSLSVFADQLWSTLLHYPGLSEVVSTFPRSLGNALQPTRRMVWNLTRQGFTYPQTLFATQYLTDLATTATAQLHRQITRVGTGPDADALTVDFHCMYRTHVHVLLDGLAASAPHFPAMKGPLAVPVHEGPTHR